MKELLNKKITKVEIGGYETGYSVDDKNKENVILVFTTNTGERFIYEAYGDCCSESWFSHISGIGNLINGTVTKITEREERPPTKIEKAEGEYDELAIYGYILDTDKFGSCYIEFRNDSNGYYGGSCDLRTALPEKAFLEEVKDDF